MPFPVFLIASSMLESIDFQMGANAGIVGMTKEHLGLALALSVPVFVVVTKIDMCPPNILQDNLKLLCKVLRSQGCRKVIRIYGFQSLTDFNDWCLQF